MYHDSEVGREMLTVSSPRVVLIDQPFTVLSWWQEPAVVNLACYFSSFILRLLRWYVIVATIHLWGS